MARTIKLDDAVDRKIAEALKLVFRTHGHRRKDGAWDAPLPDHVWRDLQSEKRPGHFNGADN